VVSSFQLLADFVCYGMVTAGMDVGGMFMSPSRTPRYALNDVTQQQNLAPPVLTNATADFDHTTLLMDETEAFALEPIDVTAIGQYAVLKWLCSLEEYEFYILDTCVSLSSTLQPVLTSMVILYHWFRKLNKPKMDL